MPLQFQKQQLPVQPVPCLMFNSAKNSGIQESVFAISEAVPARTFCPLPFVDVDGEYCFLVSFGQYDYGGSNDFCRERRGNLARLDTMQKSALFLKLVQCKFYSSGID